MDKIEPKLDMELKRKRPGSSSDVQSDTSSSRSDRFYNHRILDSSPLTAPLFSDDLPKSGSTNGVSKRVKYQQQAPRPATSSHNRNKIRTTHTKSASWKSSYRLPASSPVYHNRHISYPAADFSFASQTSTVPDEHSPSLDSESDDNDLPTLSFQGVNGSGPALIASSPPRIPRTPSPHPKGSNRLHSKPFADKNEGADLLMFLAASPSPHPAKRSTAPSTPPSKSTPLPSSMMHTPGGTNGLLGFNTPGASFNFADYLNVTPSPAQGGWKTPGPAKTPLAAREARRRLNFDGLMPPSPMVGQGGGEAKGLGMELGGELVSSQ